MNISYKWLKDYIKADLQPQELEDILTQTGLEVGGVEEVESSKGGLKGLVIGEVLTCIPHPDSDHLHVTTVNIGQGEPLPIVCGAPNIEAGQKVVVATVGTTLYDKDHEYVIRKSKIRGENSIGMICAEDEIGLGTDHEGIMVLPDEALPGTPARDYFGIESDYLIEVDLTPNRIDGASHIGVARDLAAFLGKTIDIEYTKPSVDNFKEDNHSLAIPVKVERPEACIRYASLTIRNAEIKESPDWLKNKLHTIGLRPINNVVDITNFVMMETAQPLHAFDADHIEGKQVIVKTMPAGTTFTTLDGEEHQLHEDDLMICSMAGPMCMAGVFGGLDSGIKDITKNIFIESACFDPVFIRKTARRHGLNTDASFRYERGTDPNGVIYALKRAALLMKELTGGEISSAIADYYPAPVEPYPVTINYQHVDRLIGKQLDRKLIQRILASLEIEIIQATENGLQLAVPTYRVDVKREADVIEEILRIYGYNNIEIPTQVRASLQFQEKPDPVKIRNRIAETLSAQGFCEIWSNSLTKTAYYKQGQTFKDENTVKLFNPLSQDLGAMRQTLLFGGLEAILTNSKHRNSDLRLYEFGNCYSGNGMALNEEPLKNYHEEEHLGIFITGSREAEGWSEKQTKSSFYQLKAFVDLILKKTGLSETEMEDETFQNDLISEGLILSKNKKKVAELGIVAPKVRQQFEIENPVYYADVQMDELIALQRNNKPAFREIPKYPEVRRDLALLIDKNISFSAIRESALKTERRLLQSVNLFDVYEGKGIPENQKSYAVSFTLRDDNRTLTDKQIDKIMQKFIRNFEKDFGAQLR